MSHPTRSERRRAQLALRISSLEAMEHRSLITESLGILIAGIGVPAAMIVGRAEAQVVPPKTPRQPAVPADATWLPVPASKGSVATGSASPSPSVGDPVVVAKPAPAASPLAIPTANRITVSWATPATPPKGGGGGGTSHGGSGATTPPAPMPPLPPLNSPSAGSSAVIPADLSRGN